MESSLFSCSSQRNGRKKTDELKSERKIIVKKQGNKGEDRGDGDGEFDESLSFRATTRSSRDESTDMIREGEREFFEGV